MKATTTITTMFLAAGLAMGQGAPAKIPAAPASQSTTTKPAAPAAGKPAAKPATKAAAKATPATKPAVAPAKAPEMSPSQSAAVKGKRDPFLSPVVSRLPGSSKAQVACSTGKRCLIIDQLTLQGVVKTQAGWIAVVGNPGKKVYYLRNNDAVFDGYVMRIDGDSVVFKQNTLDAMGKQTQKEVVKRVAPSA